jgi:protein-tyrosine phosphatase
MVLPYLYGVMFSIFRKKDTSPGSAKLPITTDIHSHILPGIDDGSPDVATSIKLVEGLVKLGITRAIATPHVISDLYRNNPQTINHALAQLRQEVAAQNLPITIDAAAEYMMDDYFLKLLRSGEKLLTLQGNYVLTEQSYATPTSNLNEISFDLVTAGYQPIMAHPERYGFYHNNFEMFEHLKDLGFKLQVNLLSLTGYYGKPVAKAAKFILDNSLADFVGTDLHHERHMGMLNHPENLAIFEKYCGDQNFNNIFALTI